MGLEREITQSITGKTEEECRKKLEARYGLDVDVVGKETKFEYGLFNLRKHAVCVLYYRVRHPNAYQPMPVVKKEDPQEQWDKTRMKLLEGKQDLLMQGIIRNQITEEMDEVKSIVQSTLEEIKNSSKSGTEQKNDSVTKIEELLQENEFSFSFIQMIEKKMNTTFTQEQFNDFNYVQRNVIDWIGESITIAKDKVFRAPHTYVLVGPTGVGKTTTLTKLMAQTFLNAKKKELPSPKGCFITIDNIRAGAYEQLKKLGETVGYPVLKSKTAEDVKQNYSDYKNDVDNIFIDTAGCSPSDSEHLAVMKSILDVDINPDVFLTVTASTKYSDLDYIFRNYEPFNFDKVIVTKVDESRQIGNIISILWSKNKALAYITDGQHPRDIRKANVIDILKNLSGFEIDRVHLENKFGESEFVN